MRYCYDVARDAALISAFACVKIYILSDPESMVLKCEGDWEGSGEEKYITISLFRNTNVV